MMLTQQIKQIAFDALQKMYPEVAISLDMVNVNETKTEFVGDYTVVLFPFVKLLRCKPQELGGALGQSLKADYPALVKDFQLVSGFLNLSIQDSFWTNFLKREWHNECFGSQAETGKKVMIEYSSPNTNKPLHFGHLRNIFLGYAVSNILKKSGQEVVKANLVNDRGIHICKSMVAWQRYANGATPESTGTKGDHLIGDYYVRFNDEMKKELEPLLQDLYASRNVPDYISASHKQALSQWVAELDKPEKEDNAKAEIKEIMSLYTPIMKEAQAMLRDWEAGQPEVYALWKTMNSWVLDGFKVSYGKLGVDFDKMYYESDTYLLGKNLVEKGLEKGVLFRKEDNSVWIDLTEDGYDQKLLLRGDGTSVYMTQDLGTAVLKYKDYGIDQSVYVIADEQNYHMQVLQLILKKLGEPCADGIFHLSYGMVELPTGRMKSREGTVVDADDMMAEMVSLAKEQTEELGKTDGFSEEELQKLYTMIGMGALKFYLLRVDPKKKMIFDPKESIDLHGYTATFIQYVHARICSILAKEQVSGDDYQLFASLNEAQELFKEEKDIALALEQYPSVLAAAAQEMSPSLICNYCFRLAQLFNSFYSERSISKAESEEKKQFRLMLILMTARTLRNAMALSGIGLPEKM